MIINQKLKLILFATLILVLPQITYAAGNNDFWNLLSGIFGGSNSDATTVSSMFINLDKTFRAGIAAVKITSFVIGAFLLINSFVHLIRVSDGKEKLSTALFTMVSGLLFIAFISTIDILSGTLGMGNASVGLSPACNFKVSGCASEINSLEKYTEAAMTGILSFIRLVGFIAVVKGILTLHEMGKTNGQQGSIWKAFGYMLGGVACVNIIIVVLAFGNTAAPNSKFNEFLVQKYNHQITHNPNR